MHALHLGRGTTRGALTVFPLWSDHSGPADYTVEVGDLDIRELEDGPAVELLEIDNRGDRPVLILEGQLFEGGWQHRMSTCSLLVAAGARELIEVACVEEGRWEGDGAQLTRGRRAPAYVRDAVRVSDDVQGEVWSRVAEHTAGTTNLTGSLVSHCDSLAAEAGEFAPLEGQVGVLIGIGGHPHLVEVFDSAETLRRQFDAIIEAAAMDASEAALEPTPGRRARRFLGRVGEVTPGRVPADGVGERLIGRSDHVDLAVLAWQGRDVHTRATNVRHQQLVHP